MTTAIGVVFDVLLTLSLVWTAARALASEELVTAVALFVAFGLLMTLAWVRLAAPDVALAEAGIGTGFSGALFLAAIARLRRTTSGQSSKGSAGSPDGSGQRAEGSAGSRHLADAARGGPHGGQASDERSEG